MKGLRWSLNNCFSRDFPLQRDPITLDIPGGEPYSKLFWLWIEWSQWWKHSLIKELHKLLHAGVTLTHNKLQSALPFQATLIRALLWQEKMGGWKLLIQPLELTGWTLECQLKLIYQMIEAEGKKMQVM
jgi:hypothetical protein